MRRPITLSLVTLLVAALAARAGAQVVPLDDVWFKLDVRASGYAVDPATSKMSKAHLETKAFLHLVFNSAFADGAAPGALYDWELWTKQDGGVWALSDTGQQQFLGIASGDQLAPDMPLSFQLASGRFLDGRGVFRFAIKLDKHGFLKQAKVSTLGGETVDGSTNGDNVLAGKLVVKGHRVNASKLPF